VTNRTKVLERSKVSYSTDCLEALLDSCHRNGRKAIHAPKAEKIYFDAERFRWWFKQPDNRFNTIQQWRDLIDSQMRNDPDA